MTASNRNEAFTDVVDRRLRESSERIEKNLKDRSRELNEKISQAVQNFNQNRQDFHYESRFLKILEPLDDSLKHLEKIEQILTEQQEDKGLHLKSLLEIMKEEKPIRKAIRKLRMIWTSDEVDEFGYDPVFWDLVEPIFNFMYEKYWRVTAMGVNNIPYSGRCLLVANHSGMLPYDAAMISMAILKYHPTHRKPRFLAEDFVSRLPLLAPYIARMGMPRSCPENAERLLNQDQLVGVFPEGVKGIGKHFRYRYRTQRFGRGGAIRLAIRTKSPAVPVAVVGAEEIHPVIARADFLSRFTGIPITPLPLAIIPLPTKWTIQFGEPIYYDQYTEEDLKDEMLVNQLNEVLRTRVQEMILEILKKRRSIWSG